MTRGRPRQLDFEGRPPTPTQSGNVADDLRRECMEIHLQASDERALSARVAYHMLPCGVAKFKAAVELLSDIKERDPDQGPGSTAPIQPSCERVQRKGRARCLPAIVPEVGE